MAHSKSAWGIEIGSNAIKAIRLEREGDTVSVSDFCVIHHKKVLTTPDIDEDEMTRLSLGQFISQKTLEGEHLVMSVPGHSAFARFAKLPPVEPKKVPDIVKFEAVQQIPFPIEEVEWDYQTFTSEDSPEVEVGIFAITRDRIKQRLNLYAELGLLPEAITLSPVAVYNAMVYDLNLKEHKGPVVFMDIGTRATDVIVAEEGRCWIRTFPLGGTHFTEAIASTFKLSFSKAEKLKHDAASSKYAKQIMQAMRPVFSDLLQDLQRSIGYYQSLHRESELKTLVGLGSTFRIPGLRKFIGQQLQINTIRLDEYKKLTVKGREAASFAENAVNMATAYGLALQGVGLVSINANLVPIKALREQLWHSKTKWFAAAAVIMVVGAGMTFLRPISDQSKMASRVPNMVQDVLSQGKAFKSEYDSLKSKSNVGFSAINMNGLLDYREVWPYLVHDSAVALASTDPQDVLLQSDPEAIFAIDPTERRLLELQNLKGAYIPPDGESKERFIDMTIEVELSHENPIAFLNDTVATWLRENAEREGIPYKIIEDSILCNPELLVMYEVTDEGVKEDVRERPDRDRAPAREGNRNQAPAQRPEGGGRGMNTGGATITAPGRGIEGASAFGGPGAGRQTGGQPSRGGDRSGSENPDRGRGGEVSEDEPNPFLQDATINDLAPIPDKPKLYPPGSKYYRATITFTVELIDPNAPKKPASGQASVSTTGGKESSS